MIILLGERADWPEIVRRYLELAPHDETGRRPKPAPVPPWRNQRTNQLPKPYRFSQWTADGHGCHG
ncbi:MAG: hypothetical protein H7A47_08715 [Verrucomicrobiales bacterium]|nr:hypothetical protein [Verrucomicrobiales bacterium]